jgi:hypothetical protein
VYESYSDGKIALTKAPAKALFYSLQQELTGDANAEIGAQLKAKRDYRRANFEEFKSCFARCNAFFSSLSVDTVLDRGCFRCLSGCS